MNSKQYFITLKPVGKFFFGGDATFKVDSEISKTHNEQFSSYILNSNRMPQQTSLLGMMRFLLLSNDELAFNSNENCIKDKDRANQLIGNESFSVGSYSNFGCIDNLGPCFIWSENERKSFFYAPMDTGLEICFAKFSGFSMSINDMEVSIPDIVITKKKEGKNDFHFSGKDYIPESFISVDGNSIESDKLFKKDTRIGINKNYDGKTENDAFYKQNSYKLENGYCFAFIVSIYESIKLTDYNGQIVQVGADSSSFIFKAQDIPSDFCYPNPKEKRIILLSDTYLDISQIDKDKKYDFSITKTRPFRFLKTSNSLNKDDYNIKYKPTTRCKERYELFCAGSVFYFSEECKKEEFCKLIRTASEFVKIGYNRYY